MHPDDARKAASIGVDGLVISNHGGRQLDTAPSPLEMLPAIRAAVGDDVELILDSGVRRGSDIVIARCLGAKFAIFGRPTLFGAAAAGEAGIARALQIVRNEIDMVHGADRLPRFRRAGPALTSGRRRRRRKFNMHKSRSPRRS